jgi:hypothetical protein
MSKKVSLGVTESRPVPEKGAGGRGAVRFRHADHASMWKCHKRSTSAFMGPNRADGPRQTAISRVRRDSTTILQSGVTLPSVALPRIEPMRHNYGVPSVKS